MKLIFLLLFNGAASRWIRGNLQLKTFVKNPIQKSEFTSIIFLIYSLLTRITSCLHSTLTLSGENLNWVSRQAKQEREEEEEKQQLAFNSQLREKCPQNILKKSVTSNLNGERLMFAQRGEPSPQLRQCECNITAHLHQKCIHPANIYWAHSMPKHLSRQRRYRSED